MTIRWMAAAVVLLGLAGCMDPHYPLWNPDAAAATGPAGRPLDDPGRAPRNPTLDYGSRIWQGGQPQVYQPTPGSPAVDANPNPGNQVLSPADPYSPYSASGGGYTRQGTTIIGPHGENHSIVGSTVFGPTGRACSVVGSSLFCN
jgi:hypothetical protein